MRRALVTIALLCSLFASAHAQTNAPEVTSLGLPLALSSTLQRDAEHGCSQSFESVVARGQVTLAIDRAGSVRLVLDGQAIENMGPSPGRYMAGDHDFTRLTELHRSTWSGQATVFPDGITITFDHLDAAEIRFTGWGSLPLPPATGSVFSGQMHCAIARTDVLPADDADDHPTTMPLLSCAWIGAMPEPFSRYAEGAIAFGTGAGVRDITNSSMFSYGSSHQIRRVP